LSFPTKPVFRDLERDKQILEQINEAVSASNLPLAMDMARKALADGLVHPQLYNLRAYWFEQQGRNAEALSDIERALSLAQDKFAALTAYGFMLEKLHRQRDSAEAFKEAARLAPNSAEALFNRGWGEQHIGSLEMAVRSFERALELDPSHLHSLVNLADLAYRRGDWARAREMAGKALAIDPNQCSALATLARVAIEERDLAQAEAILQSAPHIDPSMAIDHAQMKGVLGDLRHAQRRYAEAFAAYSAANAYKISVFRPKFDRDGEENAISHMKWLIDYFRDAPAEQWVAKRGVDRDNGAGDDGPAQHVFLVGFPRSGTTLLENILAAHPRVVALEEKELLSDSFETFMVNARMRDRFAEGRPEDIQKYRDIYWQRARSYGVDLKGKMFIDKHPLISARLMIVTKLFPNAKILFAIRDPRDVILSCFRRSFNVNFSMFPFLSLDTAAAFYDSVMQLSRIEHEKFGLDWHDLRHEALVADFEVEMRKICSFLGLEWSSEMNNFAERAKSRHITTPSGLQVMKGLNADGIGAWRNYKEQLAPILPVLEPWVKAYGYPPE
jgi:Tfp pilus assembly protein PilF